MFCVPTCVVCDARLDAYGRDGCVCERCKLPCTTCGGMVQNCQHPLPEQLTETHGDPFLKQRAA